MKPETNLRMLSLCGALMALGCTNEKNADTHIASDASLPADGGTRSEIQPPPPLGEAPWFLCPQTASLETATVVLALDRVDQYHGGEPNKRTVEAAVELPTKSRWQRIDARVNLECPQDGLCDGWDRFASISLVENAGTDDQTAMELVRYITPYGIGMCLQVDVTRFAPKLRGAQTVRSFIDTWVHPNEPIHGHGWRTTVELIFYPEGEDLAASSPSQITNIWPESSVIVGDPNHPESTQLAPPAATPSPSVGRALLAVTATGHGQGNADNCAEFCPLDHVFTIGGTPIVVNNWRDDCELNPLGPSQLGSWQYPRSGWCPGAYVVPEIIDVTHLLTPSTTPQIAYEARRFRSDDLYENSCRPGAGDTGDPERCEGCVFDDAPGNCTFNGGDHTEPIERVSAQLILYDEPE